MFKTKIKIGFNHIREHIGQKVSYNSKCCYCRPTDINFIVTSKCNLKCIYCDYWKIKTNHELTLNRWKDIVINLKKWIGSYHLTISGGEPLLFKDLFGLIKFASEKEILVTLITNGALVDQDIAKKIVESRVYNLIFSLDGSKKTNDYIRGKGSYDKTIESINILKKLDTDMGLSLATVISNRNLNEIVPLVKYAKDAGLDYIYFQPLTPNPKAVYKEDWYINNVLWPTETKKIGLVIDELIVMKKKNYSIANPIDQLKLMKDYFKNPTFSQNRCFVGIKNLNVDAAGNITTCFNMESIGNVFNNSIKKSWYSKKAGEIRKKIRNCKRGCSILNCNYEKTPIDKLRRLF